MVILAVGLPIWYATTSIPKEDLQLETMSKYQKTIHDRLHVTVPVYVRPPADLMDTLIKNTQSLLNEEIAAVASKLGLRFKYEVKLYNSKGLDLDPASQYILNIRPSSTDQEGVSILPVLKEITVFTSEDMVATNHVADFVAKVLTHEVFTHEMELYASSSNIAFETAANYHLSFFLLSGDGGYISWDFRDFFEQHMGGFMELINKFANFTVDSQIEYYSQLTNVPSFDNETQTYVLSEDDTSVFVNHEKWNLDNNFVAADVEDTHMTFINMIVYIPSRKYQPLHVSGSATDTFITPQYGGIQIVNLDTDPRYARANETRTLDVEDLKPIFGTFASQILTLLGMPKHPKLPLIRLDFLARYFIVRNLIKSTENLGSLVRLVRSLPSISIPVNTARHVEKALSSIDHAIESLDLSDLKTSAEAANIAFVESNLAFFEKEMVQQIYFPEEHKFAVYSPLLGPIFTILFLGLLRILKDVKTLKKHYKTT